MFEGPEQNLLLVQEAKNNSSPENTQAYYYICIFKKYYISIFTELYILLGISM